jgi:hypothetical protein
MNKHIRIAAVSDVTEPGRGFVAVRFLTCLFVLVGAFFVQPAGAEEYVSEDWQYSISPYMWALSLKGDVTVGGNKSSADIDFDTILDNLNFALMVQAEARKNRLGFFVNPLLAQLENDETQVDIEVDMAIVSFGGYYRFGPWNLDSNAGSSGPKLVTDIYAGGRYTYLEIDLKISDFGVDEKGDQDWIDPIIGVRTLWALSPKWTLSLSGDIGGFGVGSDFAWQARGLVGYGFKLFGNDSAKVFAGYRALYQDYSDGSGADKFEWDVTLHGPVIGMSIHF